MKMSDELQKSDLEIKLEKENDEQKRVIKKLEDDKEMLEQEKAELVEKLLSAEKNKNKVKTFLEGIDYDY